MQISWKYIFKYSLLTCFGRLVHLHNFITKLHKIFNLHVLNFTSQELI